VDAREDDAMSVNDGDNQVDRVNESQSGTWLFGSKSESGVFPSKSGASGDGLLLLVVSSSSLPATRHCDRFLPSTVIEFPFDLLYFLFSTLSSWGSFLSIFVCFYTFDLTCTVENATTTQANLK
jgi:hypothetical protein